MIPYKQKIAGLVLCLAVVWTGCEKKPDAREQLSQQGVEVATASIIDDMKTVVLNPKAAALTPEQMFSLAHIDMQLTAREYEADYDANEIAADQKYKGKKLLVSATVESIDKDFKGDGYLMLRSANMLGVHASLSDRGMNSAGSLSKGEQIYLVCDPSVRVVGVATLDKCQRFSQYLDEIRPSLENTMKDFLTGQQPLPKQVGQAMALMYVIGSALPANAPCRVNYDDAACESVVMPMMKDEARAKTIKSRAQELLNGVKLI